MNIESIAKLIMSLLTSHTTASKNSSKKAPSPSSPTDNSPKLREEGGFYLWDKGQSFTISKHFSTKEMTCRCSFPECKEQRISKDLIQRIEKIREEIAQPLIVTSAYRCTPYQQFLRSHGVNTVVASKSQHELGNAVDVVPKDRKMAGFEDVCAKQFESIGLAKDFLHLDTRPGKKRWNY
jgi:hypothetical protein